MNNELKNKIWSNLDKLRNDRNYSGFRDTKLLELIGTTIGTEKLDEIFANKELISKLTNTYAIVAPTYVFNFIRDLIKSDSKKSVFDPWLTISSPINYIEAEVKSGICQNKTEFDTINLLFKDDKRNITLGDTLKEISKNSEKFDFVISFPPFNLKTQYFNGTKSPFDFATTLLLECEKIIEPEGKLIFLISNSFLMDKKKKEALTKKGLFIDAVFAIPSGAFAPITGISSNLVVVSKKDKEKTFVAEISQDAAANKTIIENYRHRKKSKATQLGCFVDIMEFKSMTALVSEKEMQEMAKRIGFLPVHLTNISISINALKGDRIEDVEHLANSFYLPKVGNSPVVSSLSELNIKPKNYFQIQLDEKKANSIYVANYFNTPIGKKLRRSLEVGAVIPQISKLQLKKCILYLPELNMQTELIEVDSKIQQFSLRLDELKRDLWKHPKSYKSIVKDLKTFNRKEKLENWIDKLPFPLSSILWRYYATKDNGKKIEHLFHFFEAFSEFLSMIMLSGLVQDKEFYKEERHKWIDKDDKFQNWYLRATFGNWNVLTSRLSKAIRVYLANKDIKDYCKSLFGNPSDTFLAMLISKSIVNVLIEVANLRNKWKGHGGITSDKENAQRVLTLEQQLNELRKNIADAFEETQVLSPSTSSFEDGIYTFNAKVLIGVRTPFNEVTIKSIKPLDRKKLYLNNSGQTKPIELLPFIKYVESSDAIYFYTSIESKDVRWISYHYDKEAEIKQPADNELFRTFDFLKP